MFVKPRPLLGIAYGLMAGNVATRWLHVNDYPDSWPIACALLWLFLSGLGMTLALADVVTSLSRRPKPPTFPQ